MGSHGGLLSDWCIRQQAFGIDNLQVGASKCGVMAHEVPLLIVWHSRTGASEAMARAAASRCDAMLVKANDVSEQQMLDASSYLFVGPENLAGLSGEMKEMFDRQYYPLLGKIEGRPYASIIAAGSDGEGAQRQLDRIVKGWRLKRVADPLIVQMGAQTPEQILSQKTVEKDALDKCRELGEALAEGVRLGVF